MTHRPAGTHLPPELDRYIGDLERRVKQLEQRNQPAQHRPDFCLTATTTAVETVDDDLRTAKWFPWDGAVRLTYLIVTAELLVDTTTLVVHRGDTTVLTLEVVEGTQRVGLDEVWSPSDPVWLSVAGHCSYLMCELWFDGHGGGGLTFGPPAEEGGGEG
jgi:hypothetical protein